jgi:hypothetical protein
MAVRLLDLEELDIDDEFVVAVRTIDGSDAHIPS